jgi:RNAse (barnase) inhibitor barstar
MTASPRGEVLRTADADDPVVDDLAARGFTVGRIDAGDRRTTLVAIGRALRFPDYYRPNLDALWDCLTDLTRPTALVWTGWEDVAVGHPDDWAGLMGVLVDRVELDPPFTLVLAGRTESRAGSD